MIIQQAVLLAVILNSVKQVVYGSVWNSLTEWVTHMWMYTSSSPTSVDHR